MTRHELSIIRALENVASALARVELRSTPAQQKALAQLQTALATTYRQIKLTLSYDNKPK